MAFSGFFAAAVPAALFSYTAKNTPDEKLPHSMGLLISASIIGIIFSRSFVALLTDHFSWQVAFFIYALMIVGVTLLLPFSLNGNNNNVRSSLSLTETYVSAARLLMNKAVFMFLLAGFLLFFIYLGISSFLTFYLKGAPFYLSATMLGWMNFAGLSAVVGATIGAKLISVLGKKNILILFLSGVILSVAIIGYSPYLAGIAVGLFMLFIFVFGIQPIIISVLNQIVDVKSRGSVSSLYLLSCLMGGSIGTWGLGIIWENASWGGMIIACIFLALSNVFLVFFANRLIK